MVDERRVAALDKFQQKLLEHRQLEARIKQTREQTKELELAFDKSEDDLKALQSVGQVSETCFTRRQKIINMFILFFHF